MVTSSKLVYRIIILLCVYLIACLWCCQTHLLVLGVFCRFLGIFFLPNNIIWKQDSFRSFVCVCLSLISILPFITLARTSSTMFISESRHPCLIHSLREKAFALCSIEAPVRFVADLCVVGCYKYLVGKEQCADLMSRLLQIPFPCWRQIQASWLARVKCEEGRA